MLGMIFCLLGILNRVTCMSYGNVEANIFQIATKHGNKTSHQQANREKIENSTSTINDLILIACMKFSVLLKVETERLCVDFKTPMQ